MAKEKNEKAIVIYEVRNLTTGEVLTEITSGTFSSDRFAETISATLDGAFTKIVQKTDNIQVLWGTKKEGAADAYEQTYKGIAGSLTYEAATKELKISGLQDVSKISLGITGLLEIGPKLTEAQKNDPAIPRVAAAQLSVSVGNLNKNKEWIIDFSKKIDGKPGTYIKLNTLIDWIGTQAPVGDGIELPKDGDASNEVTVAKVKDFEIIFNEFHFNMTSKTFKFDVQSKKDQSLTFGNFTLKEVSFLVTNEPYEETPGIIKI